MNNEDLALERLKLMGMYACVRIAPYMEFKDGTKGSVLLLRYNADDSLVVIINSPERTDEYEHGKNNTLYPSEADQFYAYRQACIEKNEGHYCISKNWFDKYGIVVLADVFVSAVIADFICANLNTQRQDSRHIPNWNTSRTSNMLSQALHGCTMSEIQDELEEFKGEDYTWQRAIILETLGLFHADEIFLKNIDLDWKMIRNKYAEWLSQDSMTLKLCFAEQLLCVTKEQPEYDWRRLLEETTRKREKLTEKFRYSKYGVQELIGLYALSKYYYTEMPDTMVGIQYAHLVPQERIHIFQEYYKRFTDEMLSELFAEDDPFRVTDPTRDEAEERAKLRIATLRGKQPEGLNDEQKDTCSKYEEGFCGKYGIGQKIERQEKSKEPKLESELDSSFFVIEKEGDFEKDKKELLRILRKANSKSKACQEILTSTTAGYFNLEDKTDPKKAELINPWVKEADKDFTFTGEDFRKARNAKKKH